MKTISYHTEKEIRIGIMVALFILAIFTTIKVRELQLSDTTYTEAMSANRIELSVSNFSSMPVADAKLIEEPMKASEPMVSAGTPANEQEVALQLKTMVKKGAYWSDENAENNEKLALQMTTWLKNGTYFKSDDADELQTLNYENQTNPDVNATLDTNTPEKEVASQMRTWITKGDYWSIANN